MTDPKSFIAGYILASVLILVTSVAGISDFNWDLTTPSSSLNYTDCYDNHRCAKLLLPLDWLDFENKANVTVAIIARRATVPETDPSFGGTIIVNPGGPGGSGIDFVLGIGEHLQSLADGNKKYEILSFDPRGVGYTTPSSDCYANEYARGNAAILDRAIGAVDGGKDALRLRMAQAKGFVELCSKSNSTEDVRNFMSTTSVARDMARIVDEIEALRNPGSGDDAENDEGELELRKKNEKVPRINYWGFSYGTDLGNYFASMFPGRVDRMVLEGVQDVRDYADATWLKFGDAEKTFDYFWDACFDAGERCALHQTSDSKPEDARARFNGFLKELDQNPQPYVAVDNNIVSIARTDVMGIIFLALYQPVLKFPGLAVTLSEAMAGNHSSLYDKLGLPTSENCALPTPGAYTWSVDARTGVACGDGEVQNMTLASYQDYVAKIVADSPNFWPFFVDIRLSCLGWPFRPKDRFTGPWQTPEHDPDRVDGKPTAPLLFVSSRYDVVTPPANAIEMSRFHLGSKVVVEDSYGHTTIMTPSECRAGYVRKYFETGELPPDNVLCASDCAPFEDCAPKIGPRNVALGTGSYAGYRRQLVPPVWY